MSISSVTSEALQLKLRQLLPSQQGFGTDLSASDTIIPVIDLTASAEGSDVRPDLQLALDNVTTVVNVDGRTGAADEVLSTATGFVQINFSAFNDGGSGPSNLQISVKETAGSFIAHYIGYLTQNGVLNNQEQLWFVPSGYLLVGRADTDTYLSVSSRQIADLNGTLVQPSGFDPQ